MSEGSEIEIRAAHEELLEEEARQLGFAQRIALLTALLSTIGAVFSYQSGHTSMEVELLKSASIAKLTEASDQWSYYQAKSTREFISETAARQTDDPARKAAFLADAARYTAEKEKVKASANELRAESDKLDAESKDILRPHHRMAMSMTLIQISIALASITALTRNRWLFVCSLASALSAVGIAAWGIWA